MIPIFLQIFLQSHLWPCADC